MLTQDFPFSMRMPDGLDQSPAPSRRSFALLASVALIAGPTLGGIERAYAQTTQTPSADATTPPNSGAAIGHAASGQFEYRDGSARDRFGFHAGTRDRSTVKGRRDDWNAGASQLRDNSTDNDRRNGSSSSHRFYERTQTAMPRRALRRPLPTIVRHRPRRPIRPQAPMGGSTATTTENPTVAPNTPPVTGNPAMSAGPASVADLASGLLDAVVNISTSQKVKDEGDGPATPKVPDNSPFQEFFNDFFKNRNNDNSNRKVSSLGSGFVIDPSGYIVTNNHVIEGADDIEVIFPNGTKLKARLIGTDTKTDLSVLKVEPKHPLIAVKFGDSSRMRIGDWVMAIGNPFGLGGSVTVGIVSARGTQHQCRSLRQFHPDRRGDQQGQLRRTALQHEG